MQVPGTSSRCQQCIKPFRITSIMIGYIYTVINKSYYIRPSQAQVSTVSRAEGVTVL